MKFSYFVTPLPEFLDVPLGGTIKSCEGGIVLPK